MTVKRYTPESDPQDGPCSIWMEESVEGHYVTYSDHQKLVAENAVLKSFGNKLDEMHNDLNGEGTGIQGRAEVSIQQVALEAAMEEFDAITAPATDAAIAELRAQGVDEFADHMQSEKPFWEPEDWAMMDLAAEEAYKFAANLRAGRKG